MSKLKIYRASAGSGKTNSLTNEYLKLAALYPDNFKKILAVTFTNKAAEEMKQRILEALNDVIDKGSKALFYPIFYENDKNAPEIKHIEKAKKLRDSILHDYSYFSLSTIDSFVQRVIRSFTYEIGIESGYRIELDTEKVLADLTELLYQQIDKDEKLKNWLIRFANFKMDEGKSWDFRGEINRLAKEIFKEQFYSSDNENDKENDLDYIQRFYDLLIAIRKKFENNMADIGSEALKRISANNQFEQLGRSAGYVIKYLTVSLIEPEDHSSYEPNATLYSMPDNIDTWCAKSAKASVKAISTELYNLLNPLLVKAFKILDSDYKIYLSVINILSAFHAFGILRKLSALLPGYRADNNLLLISDTTRILKEIIAGNDSPFIYEKIGNRYKHILIDEFQDTSGFQWDNFKPLIQNNISEGNENLIVGDIKQSIYRWRGGDWNILMSRLDTDIGTTYIQHKTLDTNWRSKKNIIDFNNSLFQAMAITMQQIFDNELNESSIKDLETKDHFNAIITKAYTDVCQKLPDDAAKSGGRVKIRFYKTEKGEKKEDWQNRVAEDLPELIEQLLTQKNYQPGDIAILVRKNAEGSQVANILLDYQQNHPLAVRYQIISSESLMLINSPVVQVLVNAMYFLLDQNDNIRLHALLAANSMIKDQNTEFLHSHFDTANPENTKLLLDNEFFDRIEELKKLNVYELSEEIIRIFKLNHFEGQMAYIHSFQDVIIEFGQNESYDLNTFLNWWEEKGKSYAVQLSEQQDAVKILSIHKSKGLAFKIVIIPYCDWEIKPLSFQNNIIWTSSEIEPFNHFRRFPIIYREYLKKSIFWKAYYSELLYSMLDALNMLYVAFTRPREELLILGPAKDVTTGKFQSVSELLYHIIKNPCISDDLINLNQHYLEEDGIFELKKGYKEVDDNKFLKQPVVKSTFNIDVYSQGDWNSKINILHNADDFFIKSLEYIKTHVDYGNLMHEIFSRIDKHYHIEQLIDDFYYAGKIGSDERENLVMKIKEMINRPEVIDWFSDRWEVRTEDAILETSGKIRIPDRVLIGENETLVIDFKFGEVYSESVDQVKVYMDLLKSMDYPDVKGFIYYAEKNIVQEVLN